MRQSEIDLLLLRRNSSWSTVHSDSDLVRVPHKHSVSIVTIQWFTRVIQKTGLIVVFLAILVVVHAHILYIYTVTHILSR